ncbi:hypothetical protein PV327_011406 [Microctonus hyperodae]|uniref:Carboxylesterase type B domain-containing protein n=1 Tax=Microctonus hyperodae TaxID=165561 RepID=A0AA39C370_MICHY|nr:hypothetical protein PV327_011406 [Microctonus hyperodae]
MTRMWTNFAKYSNPTPMGKHDLLLNVTWPISGFYGNHLEINNTLTVVEKDVSILSDIHQLRGHVYSWCNRLEKIVMKTIGVVNIARGLAMTGN